MEDLNYFLIRNLVLTQFFNTNPDFWMLDSITTEDLRQTTH